MHMKPLTDPRAQYVVTFRNRFVTAHQPKFRTDGLITTGLHVDPRHAFGAVARVNMVDVCSHAMNPHCPKCNIEWTTFVSEIVRDNGSRADLLASAYYFSP